jgi:hypothetical protein
MMIFTDVAKKMLFEYARLHTLRYVVAFPNEIALVGNGFSLRFDYEQEGVNTRYINELNGAQYNVSVFLYNIRHARISPVETDGSDLPIDAIQVHQLLGVFDGWGSDVVSGRRDWLREYPGDPLIIPSFRSIADQGHSSDSLWVGRL